MTRAEISFAVGKICPQHIYEAENYFEEEHTLHIKFRRLMLVAAIITCLVTLTAFAASVFSTWGGDRLVMNALYAGDGIVWVEITNQSDKELKLEPNIKLYYYSTQELVESTGEEPFISDLTIPANMTKRVRLDLRRTYDVAALEENDRKDFYCLQLTNDSFLLGQKWTCIVSFVVSDYVTPYYPLTDDTNLQSVLPSLKAYFYNYTPDVFARWPDAFDYMELVEAELAKVDRKIVRTSSPMLYCDTYGWLSAGFDILTFDGYNKMMGRDESEHIDYIGVYVPTMNDAGEFQGSWHIPMFFFYKYKVTDVQNKQDYAFVRGNLLTFAEMEQYKVYQDDKYVIYEMHEYFYADLRSYVEDMLYQRDDVYFDDQVWERIVNYYNYFSNKEVYAERFYYSPEGSRSRNPLTMRDLMEIAKKGDAVSLDDFMYYDGGPSGSPDRHGIGWTFRIDENYIAFCNLHMNGTFEGWYLIHEPTGDKIDFRYEDVEAFVQAHGPAVDPYLCPKNGKLWHGAHFDLKWLVYKGNEINWTDFRLICGDPIEPDDPTAMRHRINEDWYVDVYIEEIYRDGVLVDLQDAIYLVHETTGDKCDLQKEDIWSFLEAHSVTLGIEKHMVSN